MSTNNYQTLDETYLFVRDSWEVADVMADVLEEWCTKKVVAQCPVRSIAHATNSFQFANILTVTSVMVLFIHLAMRIVMVDFRQCFNLFCFTINSIHCLQCGVWSHKRSRRRTGLISWNLNWMCPPFVFIPNRVWRMMNDRIESLIFETTIEI